MSTANFVVDMLVYDDAEATNDPQQRLFDYKKSLSSLTVVNSNVQNVVVTAISTENIVLEGVPTWLYIETDQPINVRFDGSGDDVKVEPSVAGTSDGIMFKRGAITQLDIDVPGATDANVKIFTGV